jgi:hypothetical protein
MKIPRHLIGKNVRLFWVDPKSLRFTSMDVENHSDVPKGKAGLAKWEERGVIEKIEDGVIYLQQSIGADPPREGMQTHELIYSVVPEVLVERVVAQQDGESLGGETLTTSEHKAP